ncbi:phosphoribosylamine--glycine ligase [Acidithiobacillus thiooxidans]|uniref:Phosphoribosylamine--glycine ligase n=1 Tax=Acidithiobacillus thiooxidans ATCC 19377 TaxID=637390 RepID=A0A543Q4F7_ACITH|nr:phosphoribosylamine--glycine ligase [Acidithiobacillus thiooxidans]TQN51210.1 Phosphoribosylamine--glycine ligase [Acidithiobacillus thiooxidans ATCC 19377]
MGAKVLVLGGGGREHAIAWKLAQSEQVETVYCAPGNPGTAGEEKLFNLKLNPNNPQAVVAEAHVLDIQLVVIGPEAPLVAGVGDALRRAGIPVFGPDQAGAMLEGSKAHAKAFMMRHGLPTARYERFTDTAHALEYLHGHPLPVVVKADGLAAGKGVVVASTMQEAETAARQFLQWGPIIIEEFLEGEEASFIAIIVEGQVLPLAGSQDHKRLLDDDRGPNTGGMGAYSPAPVLDMAMSERVLREIMRPAAQGLMADGTPYCGFLYAGLIIGRDGPKLLEFNCRLGDPETQPLMMRLRSDLYAVLLLAALGERLPPELEWDERSALCVVMAAEGYPEHPRTGDAIAGLTAAETDTVKVFHAGTKSVDGHVATAGGRVLGVTALGDSLAIAQHRAYAVVAKIHWSGVQFRRDIGHLGLRRD